MHRGPGGERREGALGPEPEERTPAPRRWGACGASLQGGRRCLGWRLARSRERVGAPAVNPSGACTVVPAAAGAAPGVGFQVGF